MSPLVLLWSPRALSPDAAVAVATLGICLGFVEFNRPGRILPGAVGLLLTLLAVGALLRCAIRPWAALLLLAATLTLIANVWRSLPTFALLLATVAGIGGLWTLTRPPSPALLPSVAILCGGILGSLSAVLSRAAYRARRLKEVD